jgi:hypothetical protein
MVHTQSTVSANWKKLTKYSSQNTNAINRQIYHYEDMENRQHECSNKYNWFCPCRQLDSNILTYFNTYNTLPDIAAVLCQFDLLYFYNYNYILT